MSFDTIDARVRYDDSAMPSTGRSPMPEPLSTEVGTFACYTSVGCNALTHNMLTVRCFVGWPSVNTAALTCGT